jgi:hypothetical protein
MTNQEQVMQKLKDKGFDGLQVHFWLGMFGIGAIWIWDPPYFYTEETKQKELEGRRKNYERMWEQANIAIDFELPK